MSGATERSEQEVRHATLVRVGRERVWQALTTGEGLDSWFTAGAEVEPRPGGRIVFRWRDWGVERYTGEDEGTVLEADPPERLVFRWHPGGPAYATTVTLTLEHADGGTVVRVAERGFPDTAAGLSTLIGNATGWGEALTLLKLQLEHGVRV
jgi:uncharacterized protein YndB with AHSA1/START domain